MFKKKILGKKIEYLCIYLKIKLNFELSNFKDPQIFLLK
jgi:hypothetical protein